MPETNVVKYTFTQDSTFTITQKLYEFLQMEGDYVYRIVEQFVRSKNKFLRITQNLNLNQILHVEQEQDAPSETCTSSEELQNSTSHDSNQDGACSES